MLTKSYRPELVAKPPLSLSIDLSLCEHGDQDPLAHCDPVWREKTIELAGRGITVRSLLDFYDLLGTSVFLHYDPAKSLTNDVVRQAILPLSRRKLRSPEEAKTQEAAADCHRPVEEKEQSAEKDSRESAKEAKLNSNMQEDAPALVRGKTGLIPRSMSHMMHRVSSRPCPDELEDFVDDYALHAKSDDMEGVAYAVITSGGIPRYPGKMVTHNWGNLFVHLLAAVCADALGLPTFEAAAAMLEARQTEELRRRLEKAGKLDYCYWVCAFCVNQHCSICHVNFAPTDSHGVPIVSCTCKVPKHASGSLSEMNKFDDMMAYLKLVNWRRARLTGSGDVFGQVVAVDSRFLVLTRVWCVAELLEAYKLVLPQDLKIHSESSRASAIQNLKSLDVRQAQASYPADKDFVLAKVEDFDSFNNQVRGLVVANLDTFLRTSMLDAFLDDFTSIMFESIVG
eukprot:TRINITY_DN106572_c0_g1_i1.p1 TRINITY_DN106572_c0_g1~~TRINITY_DN106572_c0_g1_i1.p1  ORF type:complete len:501 (+),score=87.65 TRINITY_DN106572_c0_g1_i1:144-1505(+)